MLLLHGWAAVPQDAPTTSAAPTAAEAPISLPDSRAAKAYAASVITGAKPSRAPEAEPSKFPGAWKPDAWRAAATWEAWALTVGAEANARQPDVVQRARLAELALVQQRWDDAWLHFAACGASREWMSGLLPSFLPGINTNDREVRGPLPAALPDGVVLRPSLPPPSENVPPGRADARAMKVEGFVVGTATLSMRVAMEAEGIEIDIEHRGGGAAKLSVVIPTPADWDIGNEYVDWVVQPTHHAPLEIAIDASDPTRTLYGRFQPRELAHPTRAPDSVPAQIEHGTLWLLAPGDGGDTALFDGIAKSLSRLPLHLVCGVRASPGSAAATDPERPCATVVDLRDDAQRDEKLAWLVSSIEHVMLAPGKPPPK
jgi:hypothetical protein